LAEEHWDIASSDDDDWEVEIEQIDSEVVDIYLEDMGLWHRGNRDEGKGAVRKVKTSWNLQRADCSPSLFFDFRFPLSTLARNFVERLQNGEHADPHIKSLVGCSGCFEEGAGFFHAME